MLLMERKRRHKSPRAITQRTEDARETKREDLWKCQRVALPLWQIQNVWLRPCHQGSGLISDGFTSKCIPTVTPLQTHTGRQTDTRRAQTASSSSLSPSGGRPDPYRVFFEASLLISPQRSKLPHVADGESGKTAGSTHTRTHVYLRVLE